MAQHADEQATAAQADKSPRFHPLVQDSPAAALNRNSQLAQESKALQPAGIDLASGTLVYETPSGKFAPVSVWSTPATDIESSLRTLRSSILDGSFDHAKPTVAEPRYSLHRVDVINGQSERGPAIHRSDDEQWLFEQAQQITVENDRLGYWIVIDGQADDDEATEWRLPDPEPPIFHEPKMLTIKHVLLWYLLIAVGVVIWSQYQWHLYH